MAGTSPDRSKRYESSTGSTSGNEAPVPDAPDPGATGSLPGQSSSSTPPSADPRLSMSRAPAPKADQATAVFSRRALLEAAEAEGGLRPDEPESAVARPEGLGAAGSGTAGPESAGSGTVGAETTGTATGEPETGRDDAADVEGADAAGADDDSGADPDAGSGHGEGSDGAVEGSGGGSGGSDGDTGVQAGTDADEAEDEASTDDDEAADAEPAAGTDAATATGGSEADDEADAGKSAAGSEADAGGGSGSGGGPVDCGATESESVGSDSGSDSTPQVDHPTAIFRAPRLPAVDQPTTMLKLGGGAARVGGVDEGSKDAGDAKGAEAEPRGEGADAAPPGERTSKFVALKSLDEAAPSKPSGADPDAPAAGPAEATRAIPQIGPERTTQQPLPPKPPLDLLAELTNTPPPRQTPVRTIVRRVKIWTPLAILLAIVFAVVQTFRPLPTPALALTADASYAFKGDKVTLPWPDEGQGWMDVNGIGTMDSFGEQEPVAIGSVAKAMTAYVILKEHPMKVGAKGETIPVDAKAETEGGYYKDGESTLNTVKEGDKLTQYDAIAAIMIPSANNIARLLARWDTNGSEEEFVKKMNAAAKDLGMRNTTYTDPSGLKETTVSTAEDQVKLGNELVKMKVLTDITKLPYWYDPSGLRHDNFNRLVPYDNAIGIKTGSTTAAGGNLLFAATQEVGGETAIVVGAILGQHTSPIIDTVNAVSKTAMIAAQDALTSDTILKKGDAVGYVDDGLGGQTPVVVTKDVSAVGWAGKTVKLELGASETLPHEAKTGTDVGSLTVGDGSGDGVEVPVVLQEALTEPGFVAKLTRVT